MEKISERRQWQASSTSDDKRGLWIVLGAGRLGRGFLNLVAHEQNFKSMLVVEGVNTSQEDVDEFNRLSGEGKGYNIVVLAASTERTTLSNYDFTTAFDTAAIIAKIADSSTRIASTSVGLDRLVDVAPVIASGLRRRAENGLPRILLLVCENGRSEDGLAPSEMIRREIEKYLQSDVLQRAAVIPRVVIDCAVPSLPRPTGDIRIGDGTVWIEKLQGVETFLRASRYLSLSDSADMAVLQTRKLYGYNTLHCLISVLGHVTGERSVDMVARDPNLAGPLEHIVGGLSDAICRRHALDSAATIGGQKIRTYVTGALERLKHPVGEFDLTARAMKRIGTGWYLRDGRLEGPVVDLGLLDQPWICPHLTHAFSLSLYCFVRNLDALRAGLPWLSAIRPARAMDELGSTTIAAAPFNERSVFHRAHTSHLLMEVLAEDFRELNKWPDRRWSPLEIASFLNRPIKSDLRGLPKKVVDLSCVIFDLDEGLVATESLLYLVTRDLIAEHSKNKRTIGHDDYARHVGTGEVVFFEEMIRDFQIRGVTADVLIKERESRYRTALEKTDQEGLVKPCFLKILRLLANHGIRMAVVSNASPDRVELTLDHVGIAGYFATWKSPGKGLREKPTPDMIEAVLSEFRADPHQCVVVESSVTGVEAARRAGCYCILLVNDYTSPDPVEQRGVEVLANSQALLKWFTTFFAGRPVIDAGR
jgi:beta-phosphoglucomutase-like phosphatase (HAD superfamily)